MHLLRLTLNAEDQVNEVAAKEEHHTAPKVFQPLPEFLGVDAVHLGLHAEDLAQFSAFDLGKQRLHEGIVAVHIAGMKHGAVTAHRFDHGFEIRKALTARLFHMHVLSCGSCQLCVLRQVNFFRFYGNGLDGWVIQNFLHRHFPQTVEIFHLLRKFFPLIFRQRIANHFKEVTLLF